MVSPKIWYLIFHLSQKVWQLWPVGKNRKHICPGYKCKQNSWRKQLVQSSGIIFRRDGPLKKLCWGGEGGGKGEEFSSCRNFFSLSNPWMNFFQAIAWIFFRFNWCAWIFNHLISLTWRFFLYFAAPHPPHKFSNGPSLIRV